MAQNGGQGVLLAQAKIEAATFSGPLPHPEILAKYDAIVPGAAAQIIQMAQKQSDHRMDLERKVIEGELRRAAQGLACAFIMGLAILAGGVWSILRGHDTAGASLVVTGIAAVVSAFLVGTVQRRKERETKASTQAGLLRRS